LRGGCLSECVFHEKFLSSWIVTRSAVSSHISSAGGGSLPVNRWIRRTRGYF